jgi:hypothetical protein
MNDDFSPDRDRSARPPGSSDAEPTIVTAWLRQIVHRLVSHSPRVICTRCNEEFFAAEIEVKVSRDGVREECPKCQADSFRIVSAADLESAQEH